MKRTAGILAAIALLVAPTNMAMAQPPPPNPVFVNDSAEAARLLERAGGLVDTNPSESIRLIQQVLDHHQLTVIPDQQEPGRYRSTREAALEILASREELLEKYNTAESNEASRLLTDGRLMRLVETRPLTSAGLEGLLLLGQHHLEAGQLSVASAWLNEAMSHPAMAGQDRYATLLMLAMVAHSSGAIESYEVLKQQLHDAGTQAVPWTRSLEAWTSTAAPSPVIGMDTLHATPDRVGSLLFPALWESTYLRTPASILDRNELAEEDLREKVNSGRLTAVVPAVQGEHIIFNEGAEVARMDLLTGLESWRTSILPQEDRADRVEDPIGPTAVAVDGEDVVTWIGYSREGGTSELEQVVCLDLVTGEERWRFDLAEVSGIDEPQSLYPAGPPIIHEGHVLLVTRRESRQGLKSCYLLALDRDSGSQVFLTYIASTGSQFREGSLRPLTMPVVDGDQAIVTSSIGAIASINLANGRVNWLQRMDTPVSGTRALIRIRPYDLHVPLVLNDELVSLSPDFRHIVRLDRTTGHRIEILPIEGKLEWNHARYMLTDGRHIYLVGASISAFDPSNLAMPLWTTWPRTKGEGQGMSLAGRVHLGKDRLYAPTGSSITEIDTRTGEVMRRLPIPRSSLPMVINGHLLVGGPEGLALHSDEETINVVLQERLLEDPGSPGTHLALVRIAARSSNRPALLDRASAAIDLIEQPGDLQGMDQDLLRQVVLQEIISTLDPNETVDGHDHDSVANTLSRLTKGTDLAASARLALGDWLAGSNLPKAISHWNVVMSDPDLASTMHVEGDVMAPASSWSRRRLSKAGKSNPELVPPPPWAEGSEQDPWLRRLATLATNLRSQRDIDRLGRDTAAMLEEAITLDEAIDGLELLELWVSTHGWDTLPGDNTVDQWRDQLLTAAHPVVPRSELIGGNSKRWPGKLVEPLYPDRTQVKARDAFLRSHDERLTWHTAPDYSPAWTTYLAHREAFVVHRGETSVVIRLEQLGRPPRLVSVSIFDGSIIWDLNLPGILFPSTLDQDEIDPENILSEPGWVGIEPVDDRILLFHQDGRAVAIDADDTPIAIWKSSLSDHIIQALAPWHDGVAAIAFHKNIEPDSWLEDQPGKDDMILAWFDAGTGEIKTTPLPSEVGPAHWILSNSLGDLVVGGSKGAALFRTPGSEPEWISREWILRAHRSRDGAKITPGALLVMDLKNSLHGISLETGQRFTPAGHSQNAPQTSLPRLFASGDRLWLLDDRELLILDSQGGLIGSDATSRTQDHVLEAIAPCSDGLILIDHVGQQSSGRRNTSRMMSTSHRHRIHVLSPEGRTEEIVDLFELDSKIRAARVMEGSILLATDEEVLTVTLPPALEDSIPGP